jgi:ribonucleoside-diphosphate reductase beta chain
MGIFDKRINLKPYEYPELQKFKDAIRHSFWIHTEINLTSDIQNYLVDVTDKEREVIKRAMLAISQIEVSIKRFWGDIYLLIPKHEVNSVGMTFAENEVRHTDSYSNLLEVLGLDKEFEKVIEVPCIKNRMDYLESISKLKGKSHDIMKILTFSILTEYVSLFGLFYVLMSFNKFKNIFKGMSNIVEATSKDEAIHRDFGFALINIIQKEHPELFDLNFKQDLNDVLDVSLDSELDIINWVFEKGDLDFVNRKTVYNFVISKLDDALKKLNLKSELIIDNDLLKETKWFDLEIKTTKEDDFFNKKSVSYNKEQIKYEDVF